MSDFIVAEYPINYFGYFIFQSNNVNLEIEI